MRRLVVTFVGLPGTGKSSLCGRVAEVLRQREICCDVSDEVSFRLLRKKLTYVVREAGRHPWYAWRSVRGIAATRQQSLSDLVRMTANWLARSFLVRRSARAPGVHLFDEGMFQALWSIGFSARGDSWQGAWPLPGLLLPAPSLTVFVESKLGTIERRLAARPGCSSRLEEWLPEGPHVLTKAAHVLGALKDVVARLGARHAGLHVLSVDNDRDGALEANALRIADFIQRLWEDREALTAAARTDPGAPRLVAPETPGGTATRKGTRRSTRQETP